MTQEIKFYKVGEEYGYMSNFAPYEITIDGKLWATSEHYFQGQKFIETDAEEMIRAIKSPMKAALAGRDRTLPLRKDWETVKDALMRTAVREKFLQHPQLATQLIATGTAVIIEHTANDGYWGDGGDGTGKNMLGQILMKVREELAAK